MNVAVIGMGYVGLVTSLILADMDINVVCIDDKKNKIDMLKKCKLSLYEPQCEELLKNNLKKLKFQNNYKGIDNIELFLICVGTPSSENNELDISSIKEVCQLIKDNTINKVAICIRSTIMPGTCQKIKELLKDDRISLSTNPEFLSQGTAINDFINTNRIVLGVEDEFSEKLLDKLYDKFKVKYKNNAPILKMKITSSEILKIVANSYLAMRISFINDISNLCNKMNIDIDEVIKGIKYDNRIGDKYLEYGIGYGGSCLTKDTLALYSISKSNSNSLELIKSTIDINNKQILKYFNYILNDVKQLKNKNISILGLTFKENTDDIRYSCSIELTKLLLNQHANISVYDPKGISNYKQIFVKNVKYNSTIESCIKKANIIVILTNWEIIRKFDFEKERKKGIKIYDFRNSIKQENIGGIKYEK